MNARPIITYTARIKRIHTLPKVSWEEFFSDIVCSLRDMAACQSSISAGYNTYIEKQQRADMRAVAFKPVVFCLR